MPKESASHHCEFCWSVAYICCFAAVLSTWHQRWTANLVSAGRTLKATTKKKIKRKPAASDSKIGTGVKRSTWWVPPSVYWSRITEYGKRSMIVCKNSWKCKVSAYLLRITENGRGHLMIVGEESLKMVGSHPMIIGQESLKMVGYCLLPAACCLLLLPTVCCLSRRTH